MAATHSELVAQSAKWLQLRCCVIVTEMATSNSEHADAIGWQGHGPSILVECKSSIADFRRDAKKLFRKFVPGMGSLRYYCAPSGLLKRSDIPKGWGLLEWDGRRMREAVKAKPFRGYGRTAEIKVLLSTLRRIGQNPPKGVSIRAYIYETSNRATLGVAKEDASPAANDGLCPSTSQPS